MERISAEISNKPKSNELQENLKKILETFHTDEYDINKFQKLAKNQQEFVLNFLTDIQQILNDSKYNVAELHKDIAKMLTNTPGSSTKYTSRKFEYEEMMRFNKHTFYASVTKININSGDRMLIFWNDGKKSYSVSFLGGAEYHKSRRT
jgi:hypothetical protein